MKAGEEHIIGSQAEPVVVELRAHGSWVYKYHIREVLSLQRSDQYLEEIELLKRDLPDFAATYKANSKKDRVRVEVARVIVGTILGRAFGTEVGIYVRYSD